MVSFDSTALLQRLPVRSSFNSTSRTLMSARQARITYYAVLLACGMFPRAVQSQTFRLSFPATEHPTPVTGRAYLFVARTDKAEPRLQSGAMRTSEPFFGV